MKKQDSNRIHKNCGGKIYKKFDSLLNSSYFCNVCNAQAQTIKEIQNL